MLRPTSNGASSILRASVTLLGASVGATAACLSGKVVDLGHEVAPTTSTSDDGPSGDELADGDDGGVDATVSLDRADGPEDVSAVPEASPDAALDGASLCIPNPSFEPDAQGDGAMPSAPELAVAAGWTPCLGSNKTVTPTSCVPPPADGATYLALSVGFAPLAPLNFPSSADVQLCAPLQAGVPYTLSAAVGLDAPLDDGGAHGEPPSLWIVGGKGTCDPQAQFLLQFAPQPDVCGWRRVCGTFIPQENYTHLVLIPEVMSTAGEYAQTHVLVDDLRSGGACPPP